MSGSVISGATYENIDGFNGGAAWPDMMTVTD
jgi:hypothetical protein